MRNKLPLFIGAFLIMLAACAAQKKGAKSPSANNTSSITAIKMHRTPCFGRCPDYSIEVQKGGMAIYKGYRFTEMSGIYEKNIGAAKAEELFRSFEKYRIDTCQNEYRMLVSDLPGINYTIQMGSDKQKKIQNAHFGPGFFKTLAQEMDAAIKVDASWKKVADTAIKTQG